MPTDSTTPRPTTVLLGCSKCGASLPDEAQFCLKCGKPVSSPPRSAPTVEILPPPALPAPRRKAPMLLWILLAILLLFIAWAVMSDSTSAQQVQEFVGWKQDRPILDSSFSVGPHTFRYYKFALPEGSVNVAAVGQFKSTAESQSAGNRKTQAADKAGGSDIDNSIEVFVLTESAFAVWQNGYATSSVYDSGNIAAGTIQADIPAGAGIYYLVFSNKAAPKTPKAIHAAVLLRYKSWLPDWFRRMKGRVLDWAGV